MKKEEKINVNENPEIKKWDDYVYNHPSGNIFQTSLIYNVYKSTPFCNAGVIALEDEKKNMLGVMVYVLIQEPGIKSFFSKRAIITGGLLVSDNNTSYAKILLSNYLKKAKETNAIYTELRNLFDVQPIHEAFMAEKFLYQDHLTIHIDLNQPVEALEKALHKGRASNIKRAIKKNVITKNISIKEDIHLAYDLIKKTYERINLPGPSLELFLNISQIMPDNVKFWGAYLDNKLIGCRVYLIYKDVIYDWYAASDREFSGFHASDLLPWSAMLWAKENNLKVYDFAGAGKPDKDNTVRDYKLKFGGNLLSFGRYQYIHKSNMYRLGTLGIKYYRSLTR